MKREQLFSVALTIITVLFFVTFSLAQSEEELAKTAQNPVANMYSMPFQNNTVWGVGPYKRPQNVLNIQPVIPIPLGSKVNMINRVILPVITQPSSTEDKSSTGFGDILYTMWFSPSKDSKIIWGFGPALQLPTASGIEYGSGEFGVGPSLVILTMPKQWVIGAVINNIRTFGDADENVFFTNLFVNYNFPKWYLTSAPIITADWNAEKDQRWLVPVGAGLGKVVKLGGKLPLNMSAHAYYNVIKPDGAGEWQTRFQLQFMFPTKSLREKMKATN